MHAIDLSLKRQLIPFSRQLIPCWLLSRFATHVGTLIVCFVVLCFGVVLLAYCPLLSCIDSHYLVMPYIVLFVTFGLLIGCLRFCMFVLSEWTDTRVTLCL